MIISDDHKYLFIELPRTGSSAISQELKMNYRGREILNKHANFRDFIKIALPHQKKYTTISCIRNPIDRMVSFYVKCRSGFYDYKLEPGHKKTLYDRIYLLPRVKFIQNKNASFDTYLAKFHRWPYSDWSVLDHNKFDILIRFENINEDFKTAIQSLNLEFKRELPKINITTGKKEFESYLDPDNKFNYIKLFGPAMQILNYRFPDTFGPIEIPRISWMKYRLIKTIKKAYWLYLK